MIATEACADETTFFLQNYIETLYEHVAALISLNKS